MQTPWGAGGSQQGCSGTTAAAGIEVCGHSHAGQSGLGGSGWEPSGLPHNPGPTSVRRTLLATSLGTRTRGQICLNHEKRGSALCSTRVGI